MKETDFGRGYATCLFQFTMHEWKLVASCGATGATGMTESLNVELWASAASDHLYDLVTGPRVKKEQRLVAMAIASIALECGHGFTRHNWTESQARAWVALAKGLLFLVGGPKTIEEAMDIDVGLGLRPERGTYSCSFSVKEVT